MDDETQVSGSEAPVMDTAENQTNEADVQVENQAPEANEESKESSSNATDTAEDKLYAGKYKSVEELEKAYKNAESKLGQTASERAELTRELQGTLNEEAALNPILDQNGYVDPVAEKVERLERNDAVSRFIFSHPDADGNAVKEILMSDPTVQQIQGYDAKLEFAYLKSQNMSQSKAIAEARKTAATQTQAKIVEKQTAQVETNRKAESTDEKTELRNRMSQGGADADAARREYIRKYLV